MENWKLITHWRWILPFGIVFAIILNLLMGHTFLSRGILSMMETTIIIGITVIIPIFFILMLKNEFNDYYCFSINKLEMKKFEDKIIKILNDLNLKYLTKTNSKDLPYSFIRFYKIYEIEDKMFRLKIQIQNNKYLIYLGPKTNQSESYIEEIKSNINA